MAFNVSLREAVEFGRAEPFGCGPSKQGHHYSRSTIQTICMGGKGKGAMEPRLQSLPRTHCLINLFWCPSRHIFPYQFKNTNTYDWNTNIKRMDVLILVPRHNAFVRG